MKGDAFNIRIEYSGKHAGELRLIMERPLASQIAARILGFREVRMMSTMT